MRFGATYLKPNDDIYIFGNTILPKLDETNSLKNLRQSLINRMRVFLF